MSELRIPKSEGALVKRLRLLHERRKLFPRQARRLHFPSSQRRIVYKKTGGRCHLCGGKLNGKDFAADHVLSHKAGGKSGIENFLPAVQWFPMAFFQPKSSNGFCAWVFGHESR
jgi:hypothetical protein